MNNNKLSYDLVIELISKGTYDVKPREFESDLKAAIMNEHNLNADQASKVYRKAYEDGHSAGEMEILWEAQELGELAEAILKLA